MVPGAGVWLLTVAGGTRKAIHVALGVAKEVAGQAHRDRSDGARPFLLRDPDELQVRCD